MCNFPCGPMVKSPPSNAGDTGSIPGPTRLQATKPMPHSQRNLCSVAAKPMCSKARQPQQSPNTATKTQCSQKNKQNPKNESLKVNTIIGFCKRKKERERRGKGKGIDKEEVNLQKFYQEKEKKKTKFCVTDTATYWNIK